MTAWTKDPPTEPGPYWFATRSELRASADLMWVEREYDGLWAYYADPTYAGKEFPLASSLMNPYGPGGEWQRVEPPIGGNHCNSV